METQYNPADVAYQNKLSEMNSAFQSLVDSLQRIQFTLISANNSLNVLAQGLQELRLKKQVVCRTCDDTGTVEKTPTISAYSEHGDREQESGAF